MATLKTMKLYRRFHFTQLQRRQKRLLFHFPNDVMVDISIVTMVILDCQPRHEFTSNLQLIPLDKYTITEIKAQLQGLSKQIIFNFSIHNGYRIIKRSNAIHPPILILYIVFFK